MNAAEFGVLLDLHGRQPKGSAARCPAHDDQHPSLSFNDGDKDQTAASRLASLGVAQHILDDTNRVRYANLTGPLTTTEINELITAATELHAAIVIIDAQSSAHALDGVEENDNGAVTAWYTRVIRPLTMTGAAVIVSDHVTKNGEHRGRYARGAGAKLATVDGVAYELRVDQPLSRTKPGRVRLVIAKDRPGHIGTIGTTVAVITSTPDTDDDGNKHLTITIRRPASTVANGTGPSFRPTCLMEKLSRALEANDGPMNHGDTLDSVVGKAQFERDALKWLVNDGFVSKTKTGKEQMYRSIRPYRENVGPESQDGPTKVPGPTSN